MIEVKFELEGVEKDEAQNAVSKTIRFCQQALGRGDLPDSRQHPFSYRTRE
jgi:hypothetical protein